METPEIANRTAERIITNPDVLQIMAPSIKALIEKTRRAIAKGHPFAVTTFYLREVIGLPPNPADPLLSVIMPDELDMMTENDVGHLASNEEIRFTDSPSIAQKYIGSVIMMATPHCHQKCTHCFRKNVNDSVGVVSEEETETVFADLNTPVGDKVFEVILSGGEPFTLPAQKFEKLAECKARLNMQRALRHIAPLNVSINTREPVVMPSTILKNDRLIKAIEKLEPLIIAIHILHPREITEDFAEVMRIFRRAGIALRTNHPILKSVNDDPNVLCELYTRLAALGVIPKDLIHSIKSGIPPEKCVPMERSMEIMRELVKRLPGSLVPKLQCCTPNRGKSLIDPFHLKRNGTFGYDCENSEIVGLRTKDSRLNQLASAM